MCVHEFVCEYVLSVLTGTYLGEEVPRHMITLFSLLRSCSCSRWLLHFASKPRGSSFSTSSPTLVVMTLIPAVPPGVVCYLPVVSACIKCWDLFHPASQGHVCSPSLVNKLRDVEMTVPGGVCHLTMHRWQVEHLVSVLCILTWCWWGTLCLLHCAGRETEA